MTTHAQFAEYKERLMKMDKEKLVEAIAEYAVMDHLIWGYFDVIAKMNETPDQSLALIKARIDNVFGNDDLANKYEFHEIAPFKSISDHIETLVNANKYDETIEASEHAFSYDENLGQVQDPDDFIEDCYERIIDCWLKSQLSKETPVKQIEALIKKRSETDGYGLSSLMERRLEKLVQARSAK